MRRRPPRRNGDGSRGRRSLLAAVAAGVAGIGLGVNVLRPGAYTSAVVGRGANAPVADDPNAVLGMEGLSDPGVTPTFTNRTNATLTVTLDADESGIEWDVGDDGTYVADPVTFSLASGAAKQVAVQGGEKATTNVNAVRSVNGTTTGRIDLERVIDVPQSSVVRKIQGSAKAAGNSGQYTFELENTGDVDVTLVAVGVNETTNPNVESVGKNGILEAPQGSVVSSPIPVDSTNPDEHTRVNFDKNVALDAKTSKEFKFDRFLDGNGNNGRMQGEDVRATFYFTDGSSGTVKLCLSGCNF